MPDTPSPPNRCGIDSVAIARIERLLHETPPSDLTRFFTEQELADAGHGPGRAESLAARFAAKEACAKLFPRELALGLIAPTDFSVVRDGYGAPQVVASADAEAVLDRHRVGAIALSLTHDRTSASAVALAQPAPIAPSAAGRLLFRVVRLRRSGVLANLERVFGETLSKDDIERLAAAHYGHLWKLAGEFLRFRFLSRARKLAEVRVENVEAFVRAYEQGRGVLVLTGHLGNWEVATVAAIAQFPHMHGKFHFVRRAIKPQWLDALVTRRFNRAGFGVFAKRGSLDAMLDALARNEVIVFPFDQHAGPPDGIAVELFGHAAWTFKSLAIIALATGAPVVPASGWRDADGRHVLRFEEPLAPIEHENTSEAIRINTRAYNRVLERLILRHPEQWYWVHRRWKIVKRRGRQGAPGSSSSER